MVEQLASERYEVLEVKGSPRERGYRYGFNHSRLIKRLIRSHYRFYNNYLGTEKNAVLREASKYIKPTKNYSDGVSSELEGISEGARVKLEEIMMITAFNEMLYPKLPKACTSFAIRDGASKNFLTYVGQNNDETTDPWLDGNCTTLTHHSCKDRPNALIYTYAGAAAMTGINSAGLVLCGNGLGFDAPRVGVPMLCIAREVLDQKNLDEAVRAVTRAKNRAFALNFVLGSPDGIVDIEANPLHVDIVRPAHTLCHTNHYLYRSVQDFSPKQDDYAEDSVSRLTRMQTLISKNRGKLSLGMLQEFLRDHSNEPNSICAHPYGNPRDKILRRRTFDGMIYVPEKRETWIARGNPCKSAFVKYVLN